MKPHMIRFTAEAGNTTINILSAAD